MSRSQREINKQKRTPEGRATRAAMLAKRDADIKEWRREHPKAPPKNLKVQRDPKPHPASKAKPTFSNMQRDLRDQLETLRAENRAMAKALARLNGRHTPAAAVA